MRRLLAGSLVAWALLGLPVPGWAQPRRLSFTDAATLALQQNLGLRAAALDVAVAEAQLAQARAAKGPQVSVQATYTYLQQPGQTLSFPNPFGRTPPTLTVNLSLIHISEPTRPY